ncbi:MAG: PQQ-binding-like beta-propeller repeat protein [Candidatus Methanofastidiosia archaeon]
MKKQFQPHEKLHIFLFIGLVFILHGGSVTYQTNWSQFHGDEGHTSHADSIISPTSITWENTLEYHKYGVENIYGAVSGSPVAEENRIIVLSDWMYESLPLVYPQHDYLLLCFEMEKQGLILLWQILLPEAVIGMSPAIYKGRIIVPSGTKLLSFDLETGQPLWETSVSFSAGTPVILHDLGMVVVITRRGFSAIDADDGSGIWTIRDLEGNQCHFFDVPTAGDGRIFVCYETENEEGIAAFDTNGELLWKREGKIQRTCINECFFATLYTGGILFAIDDSGTLCALDSETGITLWTYQGKTLLGNMSSDGKNLYVYSKTDEGVICLNGRTGEEIWKSPALFAGERDVPIYVYKSLVSTQNHIFICRYSVHDIGNTQIIALDKQTGERVWESEELEGLEGPLIVCDNFLIAKTSSRLIGFGSQTEPIESTPPETAPPSTVPLSPEPPLKLSEWYYLVVAAGISVVLIVYVLWKKK